MVDINNCTDLWTVLRFVNSEHDAEIAGDAVMWRISEENWQKFEKDHLTFWFVLSNDLFFQIVFSLKKEFIIPLRINDSNGTESHCKLHKWRNKLFIYTHTVHTSENTANNFVDSFSLRTQTGQQHWQWAEPYLLGAAAREQREHSSPEIKPLAAPRNISPCKWSLTQMETRCGKQGHFGDAWLRALQDGLLQSTQAGSHNRIPDHHLPLLALALHTNSLT